MSLKSKARFSILILFVVVCFCVLAYRIFDLSYFNRAQYFFSLKETRHLFKKQLAKRGNIFDRNGEILASSFPQTVIGIDPYFSNIEKDKKKLEILSDILNIPLEEILHKFSREEIVIDGKVRKKRWVELCAVEETALLKSVEQLQIKGVYGITKYTRVYPFNSNCAHVTGFLNCNDEAVCGIERYMDMYLRGQDGFISSENDGRHRELIQYRTQTINPIHGYDVIATIDIKIQQFVADELRKLSDKYSPKWASIIVSDASTGEILAMGNYPTYDPNNYGQYSIEDMRNCAIGNTYEPGSVFKIVSSSLAYERGLVNNNTTFDCTQKTVMSRGVKVKLPNDHTPFGQMSFVDVIRRSSNKGVAFMALMLGEQRMYDGARAFGFGEKTGYGFDGESSGILYPPDKWDAMTITRFPMGHAIAATPIQTHYSMSVLANDGILLSPQLFKSVNDGQETIINFKSKIKRRVLLKKTVAHMCDILNNPFYGGTNIPISFCGKSGTSQKIVNGKYLHDKHVSSFSGFFSANGSKIVITVVIDTPNVSGTAFGSRIALPVFKSLMEKIYKYFE